MVDLGTGAADVLKINGQDKTLRNILTVGTVGLADQEAATNEKHKSYNVP
jgi:hypothetical protein